MSDAPTAAAIIIGDEILSGRTQDQNTGFIAKTLTDIGIDLVEVRIVGDQEDAIVQAVRALSEGFDFVLTSGGIGPTHDDITAMSVAKAFNVPLVTNKEAERVLVAFLAARGVEANEARMRMTQIPQGARLIPNKVSAAPGFTIGNVFVMAGVPAILQAMMDEVVRMLPASRPILSETIEAERGEGDIAKAAADVQEAHPLVRIGSYPYHDGRRLTTRLVLRSRDAGSTRRRAQGDGASAE